MRGLDRFKIVVLTFLTTLAFLATAKVALSEDAETCQEFFDRYIGPVVSARDSGMDPAIVVGQLTMIGINQKASVAIVGMVYQVHQDKDKTFIETDYMKWCAGEAT